MLYKKGFIFSLCLFLCLTLGSCKNAQTVPEETSAATITAVPTEAVIFAEAYLENVQVLLEVQDYDAAIALLEEALEVADDPSLGTMLAELTASTPVTLEYTAAPESNVTIHSFTAEERYGKKIRCTLEYTAPEGMALQLQGRELLLEGDALTTNGARECLVFDLDGEYLQDLQGAFALRFSSPEGTVCTLDVQCQWPQPQNPSSYEISYLLTDLDKTQYVQFHSFRVCKTETHYDFTVEYTAAAGLAVSGLLETPTEDFSLLEEALTTGARETLAFSIEKDIFSAGEYMEVCFTDDSGKWVAANFTFPMRLRKTDGKALDEPLRSGYVLSNGWSDIYPIHDLTVQPLDNGYVRYAIEMSTPANCFVTMYASSFSSDEMLDQFLAGEGQQQFVFDVPENKLADCMYLSVMLGGLGLPTQNFQIPIDFLTACTGGTALSDPQALECTAPFSSNTLGCNVLSCAVQPLDNGFFRYALEVEAPEHTRFSVSDSASQDTFCLFFATESEAGRYTFCFDLDAETVNKVAEISISATLTNGKSLSAAFRNPVLDCDAGISVISRS